MSKPTLFSTNSLGNWLTFQTSTGSFSSNYTLSFPLATDTAVYEAFTQGMSNKTFTSTTITDASNTVTAQRLGTSSGTGFDVVVNGSTPSGANKVLVTTSATAAAWGTIPNSALTNSSVTINTGTGLTGGGTVALGGTLNLSNTGVISFSAGTTGLTPSIASTGAITLAGTLVAANGGTGQNTYTVGDILYASAATTLSKLSDVAAGSYLRSGGVGVAPLWSTLTLPNSATTGDLFYASGTNTMGNLADVATGNALLSGGVGVAPSWGKVNLTTTVSGVLPIANGGTNSSTALNNNRIMVSSGGSIVEAAALTNGQLLIGSTGAAPVAATLTAGTGISITNGAGSISVAVSSSLASVRLTAVTNQITVGVGAPTVVGYVPWQNSAYSSFTTRTVVMWVVPSSAAGKDLTVSITPDGAAALGSITILGGAAVGAIYTFTFTAPGADTNLQVTVSRTGGGGNNPLINGVTVSLT